MKKAIIIIMSLAIILPIVPIFQTKTVSAETEQIEQPFSKNKNRQAIFYAVAEKGGVTFNGADNFHDALKQSDYLHYMDSDLPNGDNVKDKLEEVKEAFDKKPIPVSGKPGVGKILLPLDAFLFSYGLTTAVIGIFDNAIQYGKNVKTLADIDSQGVSFESIGSLYTVVIENRFGDPDVMHGKIMRNGEFIGQTVHYGYGYPTGTPMTYGFQLSPYEEKGVKKYEIKYWGEAIFAGDGKKHVKNDYLGSLSKSFVDGLKGGQVATIKSPKSIGTLNPPDWTKTPETELPKTVEIELPIDEDGYPDPERQLQPDNPAKNDPKKPLREAPPDYESNPDDEDEGQQVKPGPILTPKPNPEPELLPQPNPVPPKSPPTTDTLYPDGDGPKTTPEDTQNRWGALVTNKFPFSLPWDIAGMIAPLMADPKRPFVKVNEVLTIGEKEVPINFSHNFAWMDDYIVFLRTFILIGFNIFMVLGTRKLMGGGQ